MGTQNNGKSKKKIVFDLTDTQVESAFSDVQKLKKNANGSWGGLCPFHEDKNASFGIKRYADGSVRYKCFGCDKKGSVIDYVMERRSINFREACKLLEIPLDDSSRSVSNTEEEPKSNLNPAVFYTSRQISPVPTNAPKPPQVANCTQVHIYLNEHNELLGYVYRIEKNGSKGFLPCVYTDKGWEFRGFDHPTPLYGLQFASEASTNGPVMVCEGEKTADAIRSIFGFPLCVTWSGGVNVYKNADWNPLKRFRNIIVCPDADDIGLKRAKELCAYLHFDKGLSGVRLFIPPQNWPKKTDWADIRIPREDARRILKENLAIADQRGNFTIKGLDIEEVDNLSSSRYFSIIGQRIRNGKTEIAFHRNGIGIIYMSPESISPRNLYQLAPAEFWKAYDPNYYKPANQLKLIDQIFRLTSKLPILTEDSIRGVGVWLSGVNSEIVVNDGGTVRHLDNVKRGTSIFEGHVYECGIQSKFYSLDKKPLNDVQIKDILTVFNSISSKSIWDSRILVGWTFCAPICGILNWRPHVWITGRAGSGKSFIMDFIRRLLKGCSANFQGNTTEPAIRQTINNSARPIVIDEFDPSGEKSYSDQNNIVAFARACSSGDSPPIVKGSSAGQATYYTAKSMFVIGSIVPRLEQDSDISRFAVVELQSRRKNSENDSLVHEISKRETYTEHMFSTIYHNIGKFNQNLNFIKQYMLSSGCNHRFADQYSTLLAGWATFANHKITSGEISEFLLEMEHATEGKNMQSSEIMNVLMTSIPRGSSIPFGVLLKNAYDAFKREGGHAVIKSGDCETALEHLLNLGVKYMPEKEMFYLSRSQFVIETLERLKQPINTSLKLLTYHDDFIRTIITKIIPGTPTTRCLVFKYNPEETV